VLAIVITLLVLEIKIPELHDSLSSQETRTALVHLAPNFASFTPSFVLVAVFWVNQARQRVNRTVILDFSLVFPRFSGHTEQLEV